MVWIVFGEGIEGILNPELRAATTNPVARRILYQISVNLRLGTINKVNQVPMNFLTPGEHDVSGRQHSS
jgi:hypothetical protein